MRTLGQRHSRSFRAARQLRQLGAVALALLNASCATPSVQPIAPGAAPAKAEWLAGQWQSEPAEKESNAFTAAATLLEDGTFEVTCTPAPGDKGDIPSMHLSARPFELGGKLFADVSLHRSVTKELQSQYPALILPTHVLVRIDRQRDGSVTLRFPVYQVKEPMKDGSGKPLSVVLTAGMPHEVPLALTGDSETLTKAYEEQAANDKLFALKVRIVRPVPKDSSGP